MEKKEVIIGTDENDSIDLSIEKNAEQKTANVKTGLESERENSNNNNNNNKEQNSKDEEEPVEPVPIADMEIHLCRIRQAILLSCSPGAPPDGLFFQNAEITVGEIERVELLDDLLDTVMYWATEESSSFLDLPSQLAQVEAPEVLAFCIFSQRPRIITKAVMIMNLMLEHPQTLSELHRCIKSYYLYYASVSTNTLHKYFMEVIEDKENKNGISYFLLTMVYLLHQYEGLPELVAAATRVATKLCEAEGAEKVLYSGVVGLVLSSMLNHMDCRSVHSSSVEFFSSVVGLPREQQEPLGENREMHNPNPVPLAVLFCHADELLSLMMQTFRLGWTNLVIKKHCLNFIKVCFRYAENRLALVQSQALLLTLKSLSELYRSTPELLEDALDIISYALPYLDAFQRRSVLKVLAHILHCRGEINVLLRAVALTYGLLRAAWNQQRQEQQQDQVSKNRNNAENASGVTTGGQASAEELKSISAPQKPTRLEWSPMQWHPSSGSDTMAYFHELYFPQLLIHIADFYLPVYRRVPESSEEGQEEESEEENEDNKEEQQLGELARKCVQELMMMGSACSGAGTGEGYPFWFA